MTITKSQFQEFSTCSAHFWMLKDLPDTISKEINDPFVQQIIDQGIEVEEWARKLFPQGVLISSWQEEALSDTKDAIDREVSVLFQPSFKVDGLKARMDILVSTAQGFDIYEVKGTTSKEVKKQVHYWDLAFQIEVLERAGYKINRSFLVELNKDFVKSGPIDPEDLLTISDITEEMIDMNIEIKQEIHAAKAMLSSPQPTTCCCINKARRHHCPSFAHFHPDVPPYAVHDLARIGSSPKRLRALLDDGILGIDDIPLDYALTPIQKNQVMAQVMDTPIICKRDIDTVLSTTEYPLYFLDYETYPAAVPVFDGCYPFQQVPFQYSLHVQYEAGGEITHHEYLHMDGSSPLRGIAASLNQDVGDTGSVIVWNKKFEKKCNEVLAIANRELKDFFEEVNRRLYDLADIFSKQYYVHKDFKGKYSIKKVLPVLCPDLSYNDLDVQDGGAACAAWREMVFDDILDSEKKRIAEMLLAYCELDTWAMVRILQSLQSSIKHMRRPLEHLILKEWHKGSP